MSQIPSRCFGEEKAKILRMKQASAEEKKRIKEEKERLYRIECEKRRKRNEIFMNAQDLVTNGQLSEALDLYDNIVKEDGFNPNYLCARSVVLLKLKRPEDALVDADEALLARPKYVNAYIAKASALGSLKRWKEAVETYETGRSYFPKSKQLFDAQKFAVSEMNRLAPPMTFFQLLKNMFFATARLCNKIQDELDESLAKFEEVLNFKRW